MNKEEKLTLADIGYIRLVSVGSVNPSHPLSDEAGEAQVRLLNRCLNDYPKGIIIGKDISIGRYLIGEHELTMEKVTYHIEFTRDDVYGYIASAYSPVFDSEGKPVAVAGVDLFMPDLQENIIQFLVKVIAAVMLVVSLAVCMFFLFVKKQVVHPINELCRVSGNMVNNLENDSLMQINISTGNEIEELGAAFVQMYQEIKEYISKLSRVTAERERIGAKLNVATHIQHSMLPRNFPDRKELDIYAAMMPAKEVGGDFYDFFFLDETHLAFVVADVSEKGVPAALFMVIGKTEERDR